MKLRCLICILWLLALTNTVFAQVVDTIGGNPKQLNTSITIGSGRSIVLPGSENLCGGFSSGNVLQAQTCPVGTTATDVRSFSYTGSSQTYTPTPDMQMDLVFAWGGGGCGGGGALQAASNAVSGGAGGGGGGLTVTWLTAAMIGASKTVTIGAGCATGGAAAATNTTAGSQAGTNGGNTSLGTLVNATGGGSGGGGQLAAASSSGQGGGYGGGFTTLSSNGSGNNSTFFGIGASGGGCSAAATFCGAGGSGLGGAGGGGLAAGYLLATLRSEALREEALMARAACRWLAAPPWQSILRGITELPLPPASHSRTVARGGAAAAAGFPERVATAATAKPQAALAVAAVPAPTVARLGPEALPETGRCI